MGLLLDLVPAPYRWLALALLATALVGFGWVKGASHVQAEWEAETNRQIIHTAHVAQAQAEATVKVVTEYVDRVKVVHDKAATITKEIPIYVNKISDDGCIVPVGFVRLHDTAASNTGTSSSRNIDASPPGITANPSSAGIKY